MQARWSRFMRRGLLGSAVANIFAIEAKLGSACVTAADHGFKTVKLPARNESYSTAAGTCQDGDKGIIAVA